MRCCSRCLSSSPPGFQPASEFHSPRFPAQEAQTARSVAIPSDFVLPALQADNGFQQLPLATALDAGIPACVNWSLLQP